MTILFIVRGTTFKKMIFGVNILALINLVVIPCKLLEFFRDHITRPSD